MKRIILAAGAFAAIALSATVASAAPFSGAGKFGAGFDAGIIQVHGVHRECVRGRFGWHRSTPWGGRMACRPHFKRWHGGDHHGRGHDRFDDRGRGHDDFDGGRSRHRGSY